MTLRHLETSELISGRYKNKTKVKVNIMKKIVSAILTTIMLLGIPVGMCSCGGEMIECEYCEKEFNSNKSREKEYNGGTYLVCRDCADLFDDYEEGKAEKCFSCRDLVRKKDARSGSFWGETVYVCHDCYEEMKEFFGYN